MRPVPARGFDVGEFESRMHKVQARMRSEELDAILLTSEPEVRYFTGFFTQFWRSQTRPWFVILPLEGKPIAVIPEIGAAGMAATWVEDIYTWPAPQPEDDGVSLLKQGIGSLPRPFGRIGAPLGRESVLRMPANDYQKLQQGLSTFEFIDASPLLSRPRFMKSAAEIEKSTIFVIWLALHSRCCR